MSDERTIDDVGQEAADWREMVCTPGWKRYVAILNEWESTNDAALREGTDFWLLTRLQGALNTLVAMRDKPMMKIRECEDLIRQMAYFVDSEDSQKGDQ
jgi:hypothetical protein